jgi:hypothetical protein
VYFSRLGSAQRFEELCQQILYVLFPTLDKTTKKVRTIDGAGGDRGTDSFIGTMDNQDHIFQFKWFTEGYDTSEKMMGVFGFTIRQSSYYRHAAEILGLVRNDRYRYKLTDKGEEYLKLPAEKKSSFICKLILEFPIINSIFFGSVK